MTAKRQDNPQKKSLYLSAEVLRLMDALSEKKSQEAAERGEPVVSPSRVVEQAVRQMAKRERVE